MRQLFLAAFGVLAVSGVASAQQHPALLPVPGPTYARGAAAATPVQPAAGATIIKGNGGCTNCGPTAGRSFTMSNVTGGNCGLGYTCQNGCGSLKSDLAFHFGSCKNFFSPCGPRCGTTGFAQPWGTGWACPRGYDSYTNH